MLHLYDPEHPVDPRVAPPDGKLPEPIPLLYRLTQHRDDAGPYVDTTVFWENREGLRCRSCDAGKCNFQAGARGMGSCVIRREGTLVSLPALPLAGGG